MQIKYYLDDMYIGGFEMQWIRLDNVRAGKELKNEDIIRRKIHSKPAKKELIALVRAYKDVKKGTPVRIGPYEESLREKETCWKVEIYADAEESPLCEVEIRID